MACSITEEVETSTTAENPMLDEYYTNIKGTENRLIALMTGYFSCYSVRKKGLWTVNDGQDSIVMHGCQLGDPARNGYWVYQEIVMSNLTETPLTQTLVKIEKHTHDSLTLRNFRIKNKEAFTGIYQKKNQEFDLKDIVETTCSRTCLKLDQTSFESKSYNCTGRNKRTKTEMWTTAFYNYRPQKIRQETREFLAPNIQDKSKIANHTILYFKRMPPKKE